MALEYEDSDDNFYPPDNPPVETPLYDEFGQNRAIFYRCPSLNQRNAQANYRPNIKCKPAIAFWQNLRFAFNEHECKVIDAEAMLTKRSCGTRFVIKDLVDRTHTNYKECKITVSPSDIISKTKCSTRLLIKDLTNMKINTGMACHSVDPGNSLNSRICRSAPVWKIMPLVARFQAKGCYNAPYSEFFGQKQCFSIGKGILTDFRVFTHVCRIPGIVEAGLIKTERVCRIIVFGENVPSENGTVAPRLQTYTCHKTGIFVLNPLGYKANCNTPLAIPADTFKYTSYTCRMTSKLYHATDMKTQRFNCGIIKLVQYEGITYGRIFGGRPPYNAFTRLSGRMIGRISDS